MYFTFEEEKELPVDTHFEAIPERFDGFFSVCFKLEPLSCRTSMG